MSSPTSLLIAGPTSYHILGAAALIDTEQEVAWDGAKKLVTTRPDFGWVLGRFVAADTVNQNGHIFRLADVQHRHHTVVHTALNMLHRSQHVVGTVVGSEIVYPTAAAAEGSDLSYTHTETLSTFWKNRFPLEWDKTQEAHASGQAFKSMECIPEALTCAADGCGQTFDYRGPSHESYCGHLRGSVVASKFLERPRFIGEAVVIPPARPGWRSADITTVAAECLAAVETDEMYAAIVAAAPHLSGPAEWESLMRLVQELAVGAAYGNPMPKKRKRRFMQSEDKTSKLDAHYRPANDGVHSCATCANYSDGMCAVVDGPINPGYVSDLWTAITPSAAAPLTEPAKPKANTQNVIIAAIPDEETAKALAALGTEDADTLHITMMNIGELDPTGTSVGPYEMMMCMTALGVFAAGAPSLEATISGVGVFNLNPDWTAVYASVDSPGLNELQSRLVSAFAHAGIHSGREHGFTPHITLAYGPPGTGPTEVPNLKFTIDTLELWWGDSHVSYGLENGEVQFYEDRLAHIFAAQDRIKGRDVAFQTLLEIDGLTIVALVDVVAAIQYGEHFDTLDELIWYAVEGEDAKDYNTEQRRQGAREGWAMPDGSFPVKNLKDLSNAMQSFGRATKAKRAAVKRFLIRRANALGAGADVIARIRAYST